MPRQIPTTEPDNEPLRFKHITFNDARALAPLLAMSTSRTCDFTLGGMIMWADYFNYDMAIYRDTLFVRGVTEDDISHTAFSMPVGKMPLRESLDMIRAYCSLHNIRPELSAVPEDRLLEILDAGPAEATELTDWADYLYEIEPMSTFAGKKLSKKRNHVHRFAADNPDAIFRPITAADADALIEMTHRLHPSLNKSLTADYELIKTVEVIRSIDHLPGFYGALLEVPGMGIASYTIGEPIGDTLYAHIEKIDHEFNGAGETVSSRFCAMMKERFPGLRYVNREEDTGDPGLRKAKQDYHPAALLRKYNVTLL